MKSKVVSVDEHGIQFDNGILLSSDHCNDCCESHYLDFEHISIEDFQDLQFDLSGDNFFNEIEDYGIELVPIVGHSVKIPGYGYNNGYYSSDLSLVLIKEGKILKEFDISDCQDITWE